MQDGLIGCISLAKEVASQSGCWEGFEAPCWALWKGFQNYLFLALSTWFGILLPGQHTMYLGRQTFEDALLPFSCLLGSLMHKPDILAELYTVPSKRAGFPTPPPPRFSQMGAQFAGEAERIGRNVTHRVTSAVASQHIVRVTGYAQE